MATAESIPLEGTPSADSPDTPEQAGQVATAEVVATRREIIDRFLKEDPDENRRFKGWLERNC